MNPKRAKQQRGRAAQRAKQKRRSRIANITIVVLLILCIPLAINLALNGAGARAADALNQTTSVGAPPPSTERTATPPDAQAQQQSTPVPVRQTLPAATAKPTPNPTSAPTKAPTPEPTEQPKGDTRNIDPNGKMIALTFDDGPSKKVTTRILDVLEEYDARATFFVVGNRVKNNADVLKRAYDAGHQIGNHTYSHKNLKTNGASTIKKEIKNAQNAIKGVLGVKPALLRPPYGSIGDKLRDNAGMPLILWSLDTRDWESRNASKVVSKVMNNVKDGDIILMHDLYASTASAVETIVPKLVKQGYQLVTVEELFTLRGKTLQDGKSYRQNPLKNSK